MALAPLNQTGGMVASGGNPPRMPIVPALQPTGVHVQDLVAGKSNVIDPQNRGGVVGLITKLRQSTIPLVNKLREGVQKGTQDFMEGFNNPEKGTFKEPIAATLGAFMATTPEGMLGKAPKAGKAVLHIADDLVKEAKKYGSAEEFLKANPEALKMFWNRAVGKTPTQIKEAARVERDLLRDNLIDKATKLMGSAQSFTNTKGNLSDRSITLYGDLEDVLQEIKKKKVLSPVLESKAMSIIRELEKYQRSTPIGSGFQARTL